MSCHCCVKVSNRHWWIEAWRNAYALKPSSNAAVFPWEREGVGGWVAASAWQMWSTQLFHQSLSHSRNASTRCISSKRSSTSSAYHIACTQLQHHSTLRAITCPQLLQMGWLEVWVGMYLCPLPYLHYPPHPCSSSKSTMDVTSPLNLPLTPPIAHECLQPWEWAGCCSSQGVPAGLTVPASHYETYNTFQQLCQPLPKTC